MWPTLATYIHAVLADHHINVVTDNILKVLRYWMLSPPCQSVHSAYKFSAKSWMLQPEVSAPNRTHAALIKLHTGAFPGKNSYQRLRELAWAHRPVQAMSAVPSARWGSTSAMSAGHSARWGSTSESNLSRAQCKVGLHKWKQCQQGTVQGGAAQVRAISAAHSARRAVDCSITVDIRPISLFMF